MTRRRSCSLCAEDAVYQVTGKPLKGQTGVELRILLCLAHRDQAQELLRGGSVLKGVGEDLVTKFLDRVL